MKRAFTLVELAAVATIILIACALAAPAIHSLLLHNQRSAAIHTFSTLLANAQVAAKANFTTTALRVERTFKVDDQGQMIKDVDGHAQWLNHQQVRLLIFGSRRDSYPVAGEQYSFRQLEGTHATAMPRPIWLAPDCALSLPLKGPQLWQPWEQGAAAIDPLDTFYVVFNRRGELIRYPAERLVYLDETQGNIFVDHPDPSARAVVAYDRRAFETSGHDPTCLHTGAALHISRYSGSVIPVHP